MSQRRAPVPEQTEEKSVGLDVLKKGVELHAGHKVVLIIDGKQGHGHGHPGHGHDPGHGHGHKPPPHHPAPHHPPAHHPPPHPPAPHHEPHKPPPAHHTPAPHHAPPVHPHPAGKKLPPPYDKWQKDIEAAAKKHKVPAAFICAVIARETGGKNEIGDYGHGHGLMQIDDRFHHDWLAKNRNGMDPASNIDYGASILRANLDVAQQHSLKNDDALKFAASAYNAGVTGATEGLKKGNSDLFTTGRDFGANVLQRMKEFEPYLEPVKVEPGSGKPPPAGGPRPGHAPGHGHPAGAPHPAKTDKPANENERAYQFGQHVLGKWIHDLKKEAPWSHYLDNVPDNECCSNFVSACFQQAGLITRAEHDDNVNGLAAKLDKDKHWERVSLRSAHQGDFVRLVTGPGANDRHAVMFSHTDEHGQHWFLGSNNVESRAGHPQQISIHEMGYTVESVHHYKGPRGKPTPPPRPGGKPPANGHHGHPGQPHEGGIDKAAIPEPMRKWADFVEKAAVKHDLPPAFIAAVIDRETGGVNEIGDYGHGHGLMQIDNRWHEDWLRGHQNGMDPESNIDFGSSLLRGNLNVAHQLKLKSAAALRFAAAAYNAGTTGAENGLRRGDVDLYTTKPEYGRDVLSRMAKFEKGFGTRPVRPGTGSHPAGGHPGHHPGHEPAPKPPPKDSGVEVERAYAIGKKAIGQYVSALKHEKPWSAYLDAWVDNGECCANFVSACYQQAGLITHAMHSDSVLTLLGNLERSGHWQKISIEHAVPGDYVALKTGSEHAVMFSHKDGARHYFLGSNNVSSHAQKISIEEMGYPIIQVMHYKGTGKPLPHPAPEAHALVDVRLEDADKKGQLLAGAHVEVTAHGKKHAGVTDAHGKLVMHLEGKNDGAFELVVESQGKDAKPAPAPAPKPVPKPHGDPGPTYQKNSLTRKELHEIYANATAAKIAEFCAPLGKAMREFEINTPRRMAAFLAQIGEESGELQYVEELASGAAYEGRKDLGNTHPGDGVRFKGRGLIQITGRANYEAVSKALHVDVVDHPKMLCEPDLAARASAWWYWAHGLNKLADEGQFYEICVRVNGGTFGLTEREQLWARAKKVLGNSTKKV